MYTNKKSVEGGVLPVSTLSQNWTKLVAQQKFMSSG